MPLQGSWRKSAGEKILAFHRVFGASFCLCVQNRHSFARFLMNPEFDP